MRPNIEEPKFPAPGASDYLLQRYGIKRTPATLAKYRSQRSDGPVFFKVNRQILYPQSGLDTYAATLLTNTRRSTSDSGEATASRQLRT